MITPADVAQSAAVNAVDAAAGEYNSTMLAALDDWDSRAALSIGGEIKTAIATAANAATRANEQMNDVQVYPEGRKVNAAKTLEEARAKVAELIDTVDARLSVAEAHFSQAAMPTVPSSEKMTARHDADMFMNLAKDKAGAFRRLAARQDAIGGLVNGPYGELLLEAHGVHHDNIPGMKQAVRTLAIKAAAEQTADKDRAAAAKAYFNVHQGRKARDGAMHLARMLMSKDAVPIAGTNVQGLGR